jgi:hypothetical protein
MKRTYCSIAVCASLLGASFAAAATTFTSVADGPWYSVDQSAITNCLAIADDPWNIGANPGAGDTVEINNHILVNFDVETYVGGVNPCVRVPTPEPTSVATLDLLPNGDISIDSRRTLVVTGTSTWSGGTVNNFGEGHFINQGALTMTGAITLTNGEYDNAGSLVLASTSSWNMNGSGFGSTVNNLEGATWQFRGDSVIDGGYITNNYGLILKTDGGVSTLGDMLSFFNEVDVSGIPGAFEVDSGVLDLGSGQSDLLRAYSYGAAFNIAVGAAIELNTDANWYLSPSSYPDSPAVGEYLHTGVGGGEFRVLGGAIMFGASTSYNKWSVLDFEPGMLHVQDGGSLECLTAPGLINRGEIVFDHGTLGGICNNEGTIRVPANGLLDIAGAALTNAAQGTIEIGAGATINGPANSTNNGYIHVQAGATPAVLSEHVLSGFGTLELLAGAALEADQVDFAFYGGTVRLDAGSALTMVGSEWVLQPGSGFAGSGSVQTDHFVDQYSNLDVGSPLGTMYLTTSAVYQEPAALTEFHIQGASADTEYSQLFLSGDLQPNGRLRVIFENNFAPHSGNTFDLISVNGAVIQPITQWQVQIAGLTPGFQYSLMLTAQNIVRLTALNDGISLPDPIFGNGFDGN